MFILTHQSHPDGRGEFDGFSKNKIKYFPPSKLCKILTSWAWRVSCSIKHVFKKIAFLQQKKFVRNCQIPSISPRLTVLIIMTKNINNAVTNRSIDREFVAWTSKVIVILLSFDAWSRN